MLSETDDPESDRTNYPLAYLLTMRTYGTWVHGDKLGSVNERQNHHGQPLLQANPRREAAIRRAMPEAVTLFSAKVVRNVVADEIEKVGTDHNWRIWISSVQPTHVHVVATTGKRPRTSTGILKARISLALHRNGHFVDKKKIWAEGASGRYLWTDESLSAAIDYVAHGQSMPASHFEEWSLRTGKKVRNPIEQAIAFMENRKR